MQFITDGLQHTLSTVMVFQSDEYGKFKMLNGNRQLNERKINRIIKDIQDGIDVLKYYPIQVIEKNSRLEIIDGQHRFFIAKKLKRSVHYIIMKEDRELQDIAKINSNTEKWKIKDFINCYKQQGNKNYELLEQFLDTYGFAALVSMRLLNTGSPGTESGGEASDFQRGLFTVNYWDKAVEIAELCKQYEQFPGWKERGFIIAIYRIREAGKVKMGDLFEKYQKHPEMLQKQGGFKEYIFNLESIYNKLRQNRVVLY